MKYFLFGVSIVLSIGLNAQDFSNKGKDFWVGYGYHAVMNPASANSNEQNMVLYFATDQVTTITITIPGTGYTQTLTSTALPGIIASAIIPKTGAQDARLLNESTTPENKGIHITSDKPVVAYAHIYNASVSGACILFPTNTLGKEYYSINYNNVSNVDNANCWFYVIAVDTGTTTVEITPSYPTINHPAGIPFTVNLTQGQIYNLMGQLNPDGGGNPPTFTGDDLTGSKIKSISTGTSSCKKIAVFSGSGRISISCDGQGSSSDNYMVQAVPRTAWGKKYLTVPSAGYNNVGTGAPLAKNIYRICVLDPVTVVTVNGAPVGTALIDNFYYEIPVTNIPQRIEADQPVMVAQYFTSRGECGNGGPGSDGDPETIYLSPVEQNINKVTWNACAKNDINVNKHYINVVITNAGTAISSFKLDGVPVPATAFVTHPQDPGFSYAIFNVSGVPGSSGIGLPHTVQSDSGFNAIAYGYGLAESYGYNAGTNIKDLYNFLTPINPLSISPDPVACTGSDFYFSVTFPFQPTSLLWNFHNSANLFPNSTSVATPDPSLILDGTYFIGTRQVWRYKLPFLYRYIPANSSPGYPVTITAGTTNIEGCGNSFERDFFLAVYDPPNADYSWVNNGCITDSVRFTDITNYVAGTYSYRWYWDFGDGQTANIHNPAHLYSLPGTYHVKFALISNVGCLSDTMNKTIVISPLPVATMSGNTVVCKNAPSPFVTFTGTVGTAPFTFTYKINGGPDLTVNTPGNIATVPVPTNTVGTYNYTLVGVQGENCYKAQPGPAVTVTVNPLPSATINGSTTVCKNAAPPTVTFTAANSTAPYTFIYKINGGPDLTITTVSGNSISIPAPTNTVGIFTYTLESVRDGSTTSCIQNQPGTATVNIKELPVALISGSASVCLNAPTPFISFTGSNGASPYTFIYKINGGAALSITTTSGNTVTIPVPTNIAGTFNYTLVSVSEASTTACSQAQGGSAIVTIYPLPTADFTFSLPSCESKLITFNDASLAGVGSVDTWHWDFSDGSPVETTQQPVHIFATAGTFPVKLYVVTSNGCQSQVLTKPVVVNATPHAGFINPEVCLSDTYAQFTDTSQVVGGTIAGWQWNFGDPSSGPLNFSTLQNPTHSYHTIGTKDVKLIVTSLSGCRDTIIQSFFVNGDVPVANLVVLNAGALCANDSVHIRNTSTVDVGSVVKVDIYWDNLNFPGVFETDDLPYPGKQYSHIYPNFQNPPLSKNFQVRFRAYSGATCINDKLQLVTVNAAPKVVFNSIPDTCLNIGAFQLTEATEVSGLPGSFVYTGPGVTTSGIFNPALVGPGIYNIHYTFISDHGCSDSGQKTIKILAPPVARFGFSKPACESKVVIFSDSSVSTAGTISSWHWDFHDGTAAVTLVSGNPFPHTFATAGNYDVTLTVTTDHGCVSSTIHVPVLISALPVVNFTFTDTACLPNAVIQFTNHSSIADGTEDSFIYTWNYGDGSSLGHAVNPQHTYHSAGPFTVTLDVKTGAQCSSQHSVLLNSIHPRPDAGFKTDKPSICIGDHVTFIDQSDPRDGTATGWYWNFGDNDYSSLVSPVYTYTSANSFNVYHSIVNSFGCPSDTATIVFHVYPYPVVNAGEDKTVLEGESVILNASATGNGLTYVWTKDVNVRINLFLNNSEILQPVSTPVEDINYTLTVTGQGGCPASDQVKLKVLKSPMIPNTFSPNNDSRNDRWEIKYLQSYPFARVQVFSRTGQLLFESKGIYKPWDGTTKGKPLPVDTYYYIIEAESGRKPVTGYVTIVR